MPNGETGKVSNNDEKKRWGRRANFGIASLALITFAFYVSMIIFVLIKFEPEMGIKWWLLYASFTFAICGLTSGLLTFTDIKGILPFPKK